MANMGTYTILQLEGAPNSQHNHMLLPTPLDKSIGIKLRIPQCHDHGHKRISNDSLLTWLAKHKE
jgi:hypothetical protein